MSVPKAPPTAMLDRYHGDEACPIYTGRVRVTGGVAAHGRASGVAVSDDGALALQLRLPVAMGGDGGGTNPEQLVAAGYAACFHGAMMLLATRAGVVLVDPSVEVAVTFARDPVDGMYLLSAEVLVRLPGIDEDVATGLVRNTERACPYAKMFRDGITHVISVTRESVTPPGAA